MDEIGPLWQRLTSHEFHGPIKRTKRRRLGVVDLPAPAQLDMSLGAALDKRRSRRHFEPQPISLDALAALAWAAYGINARRGLLDLHTSPSAGATYPLELYVIINRCEKLQPGLYQYGPQDHKLIALALMDLAQSTTLAFLDQPFMAKAAGSFVWTAVISRCQRRYQQRAYRYVYLEAGHQAQNLLLAAAALGLAAVPVGAFFDRPVAELVGADGQTEFPLYAVSIGLPAPRT